MKKRQLLALGLMGGIIFPLSTSAYDNGIYTGVNENGDITVVWNDATWGNINLTLAGSDLSGTYRWGNNIAGNSTPYNGLGNNDRWGGGGDNASNGYNPTPTNYSERQGPCDTGYHVPSRGELNALTIAWCNIDTGCNARYSDSQVGGVAGDLRKADDWTDSNKLIYISKLGLGPVFKNTFAISTNYYLWSSSPDPEEGSFAWDLYVDNYQVNPYDESNRNSNYHVRCFKNTIVEPSIPQTYTLTFLNDGVGVRTGEVVDGQKRTGDTSAPEALSGYSFDYRYADGETGAFNFTERTITSDITLYAHWTFTATVPNGIYTGVNENGDITVIWNDATWGNINLTLAGSDLPGTYKWGSNLAGGPTNYYGSGNNNRWGGSGDTNANGFDDGNERYKRQGPCPVGYHVPSRGELNALTIAWCNIDAGCNARYSDSQIEGVTGDLQKAGDWTENNKLIYINGSGLGAAFGTAFNMINGYSYWLSSPRPNYYDLAMRLRVYSDNVNPGSSYDRNYVYPVRCLKNTIVEPNSLTPTTYTLTFATSDGNGITSASTGAVENGTVITLSTGDYVATKTGGYIHIGWNTDPTATGALESITMTGDVTVYAIFKKVVTVNFVKGPGVLSVSPALDFCTAWNVATSCPITATPVATCQAGYYNPVWSITDMSSMSADVNNTATCTACGYGTYTTGGNTATSCNACTPIENSDSWNSAGTSADTCGFTCKGGYKYDGTNRTCTACGTGKYSYTSNQSTTCSNINAGCYGSSASNPCPNQCTGRTKYSAAGASECSNVTAGYYTTGCNGSGNKCTGQSQCTAGTYCADGVQHNCVASTNTQAGTYSSTAGATGCTIASDGYYVATDSATSQTQCTAGNYCVDGKIISCTTLGAEYTSDAGANAQNKCYKTLTATFNENGATSVSSGSITCKKYYGSDDCSITTPTITPADGFTALGFNTDANATGSTIPQNSLLNITGGEVYYAITKSSSPIQITFNVNGNGGATSTRECYRYNGSGSCSVTSPDITPANGFTSIGWSTNTGDHTNEWTGGTPKTVSGNATYYAQSSKSFSQITVTFNVNGNSGTTENEVCTPVTVYNGIEGGSCEITSPAIIPANGFTSIGWSTNTGDHTNEWTGGTAKTVSGNATYYAQSEKAGYQVTASYVVGTGVSEYSNTPNTCNVDKVYNGDNYVACNITLPDITLLDGYNTGVWSTGDNVLNPGSGISLLSDGTYTASATPNIYTVTYDVNSGNALTPNTGAVTYDATYGELPTPSRSGYSFNGRFTATTSGINITSGTIVSTTGDHTLYAQWIQNQPSGGPTGGGGGGGSSPKTPTKTTTGAVATGTVASGTNETNVESDDKTNLEGGENQENGDKGEPQKYSDEMQKAYEFAHKHGITTMPTINQASMTGTLTRIAMAKMLSYYAINVLGMKPDETRINKFNDVSDELDVQYDNGVTLAYQLGIMGINMPNNNFRPNDEVTRGEFATALSRMLYGIEDGKDKYYSTHLAKLMVEKIITNDDPMMKELRGYVMIMLMRSAENK